MKEEIIIYTDGACSGNPGAGGWGAVIIFPENMLIELGGGEKTTTNNRMEMTAAISALKYVEKRTEKIKLYTDSSILINGITKWIWAWRRRGWVNAEGQPVANKELWEKLWQIISSLHNSIEWVYVKGHAGYEVNERCDVIAVSYSKNMPVKLYNGEAIGCGYSLLPPENCGVLPASINARYNTKKEKDKFYISLVNGIVKYHKTWAECEARVKGKPLAHFKKVYTQQEAEDYLHKWGVK